MSKRSDARWCNFPTTNVDEFNLVHTNRLETLFDELPRPDSQRPSLCLFLGGPAKSIAVKNQLTRSVKTTSRRRAEFYLHTDCGTTFSDRPRFIVEGDLIPHRYEAWSREDSWYLQTTSTTVTRRTENFKKLDASAVDIFCSHVLLPYLDVVCVFLDDYASTAAVVRRLACWTTVIAQNGPLRHVLPHLLFVTSQADRYLTWDEISACVVREGHDRLERTFSTLSMIDISPSRCTASSSTSQTPRDILNSRLLRLSDDARNRRVQAGCWLTARHLGAMLTSSLEHTSPKPVDLIELSRLHHRVSRDLTTHLSDFVSRFTSLSSLKVCGLSLVASSLLTDHYLPEMHRKPAVEVYRFSPY